MNFFLRVLKKIESSIWYLVNKTTHFYKWVRVLVERARLFDVAIVIVMVGVVFYVARATTPDPGHAWTGVGDGTFIVTGPSTARTYTFPDANATVLSTNASVTVAQGGTGISSLAQGDILYASAVDTLSALAKNTSSTRYLSNTGTSNNPAWAQIDMTNGVTGILPSTNGGTGNDFTKFTGPATSEKTFTLPNASATILTDNAVVTLTQGGSAKALTASNGGIVWTDSDSMEVLSGTATANKVLMSGSSATPVWSTPTYPNASATSGKIIISDGTNYIASTPTFPNSASTSGQQLIADGTNFVAVDIIPDEYMRSFHIYEANLTAVTALATNTSMMQYAGRAAKAYTSCDVRSNVTTAAATITWAEVGIFEGALPGYAANASLTRDGYTDVSATFNSTGRKTTTISVSGIAQGDDLWVAYGSQATTPYQVRGSLADDLQEGVIQTYAGRISTAGSPQATVVGSATVVPARFVLKCT